jgi:hypothetical protein
MSLIVGRRTVPFPGSYMLLAHRNAITGRRPTGLGAPTNGIYGQPQQQPTVDATAEWEESAETDLNSNDFLYRNEDDKAIVDRADF